MIVLYDEQCCVGLVDDCVGQADLCDEFTVSATIILERMLKKFWKQMLRIRCCNWLNHGDVKIDKVMCFWQARR